MDSKPPLIIGYSGSLAWYGGEALSFGGRVKDWFWTYSHRITDPSTRSAWYLFQAIRLVKEKYGIAPSMLSLEFWGKIDPRYHALADQLGIKEYVHLSGYIAKADSLKKASQCDVMFLPMESESPLGKPLFIPGKAFEYMKTGKVILALAGDCDCIDILKPSGLLMSFAPRDIEGLAARLSELCRNRSLLGQYQANEAYISGYSFLKITEKMASVFDAVLQKTPQGEKGKIHG